MPAVPAQNVSTSLIRPASDRWIINSWTDQTLIIFTPLLSAIVVFALTSRWVGVTAETIGLIVASFFALGHHLPGMMRAYWDRDVFQRFHWRFILVPPIVFAVFFPLYLYHFNAFRLITISWATWHGLMQLYGFARIYDMKVGSKSIVTAYLDWLLCLSWFVTAQITSPRMTATLLEHWYGMGGALIPPVMVWLVQQASLAISIVILIGFGVNCALQFARGESPNPIKLLMLASGIGFWWFAAVMVENLVLGIALFDISHDVQYMAITWLYNCRRVNSSANIGKFMRFVFRRGMVLLYIGLIVSYGAIGLIPSLVHDETVKTVFTGFLWTSTILHYYMDGFIWKVRESSTRASLGLSAAGNSLGPRFGAGGLAHLLKWSPLIAVVGWLFVNDLDRSSLSVAMTKELDSHFTNEIAVSASLPESEEKQSWLYSRFLQVQNIAAAVPNCRPMQTRAGIMLANFGRLDEAAEIFEKQLALDPNYLEAYMMLGTIRIKKSDLDAALNCFEKAVSHSATAEERSKAKLRIGEVYVLRKEFALAKSKFEEAIKDDPKLEASIDAARRRNESSTAPQ